MGLMKANFFLIFDKEGIDVLHFETDSMKYAKPSKILLITTGVT